ncbi:uncharacterized protein FIBRA_08313 [Fibroporia radiculosa]|uniref:Uncharacterized protein n=1 Tax=Fibroporia radiculosa TaxID=599839 RepID=J4ICA4_9APHY|nr:uncharacterized protein FIBRA_08313 [Fibroporia radiculosa]CCM06066.1 predicted protein [Fibroporia radiculosa]
MSSGSVVGVGSTPSIFRGLLQDAGYTYANYEQYSKYKSLPNAPNATALALFGHDDGLASAEAINKLLDDKVILLLFAPSTEVAQALKDAAKTVLDIPKIKLDEGVAIVAYKMVGLDLIHLIPGFSITRLTQKDVRSPEAIATRDKRITIRDVKDPSMTFERKLKYAIGLIAKSVAHASDEASLASIRATSVNLTPPSDTSFVSNTSFSIQLSWYSEESPWSDESSGWSVLPESKWQWWDLSWTVYLYTYATNNTPNPNSGFASGGGVVYTIATYGGSCVRWSGGSPRWFGPWGGNGTSETEYWFLDEFAIQAEDTTGLMTCYRQQPSGGSHSGTTFTYNIDFSQTLNLFKNSGKTPFQWQASYGDSYTRDRFMETPVQSDLYTFTSWIDYNDYYDRYNGGLSSDQWWNHGVFDWSDGDYKTVKVLPNDNFPIHGLNMWTSNVGRTNIRFASGIEPLGFKSNTAWGQGHFVYAPLWGDDYLDVPLDLTFGG